MPTHRRSHTDTDTYTQDTQTQTLADTHAPTHTRLTPQLYTIFGFCVFLFSVVPLQLKQRTAAANLVAAECTVSAANTDL